MRDVKNIESQNGWNWTVTVFVFNGLISRSGHNQNTSN